MIKSTTDLAEIQPHATLLKLLMVHMFFSCVVSGVAASMYGCVVVCVVVLFCVFYTQDLHTAEIRKGGVCYEYNRCSFEVGSLSDFYFVLCLLISRENTSVSSPQREFLFTLGKNKTDSQSQKELLKVVEVLVALLVARI